MSTQLAEALEAQAQLLLEQARRLRAEDRVKPAEAPAAPAQQQLYTVRQIAERHANYLTEGALRRHLFHRTTNGLLVSGALAKMGSRVFIDEARFLEWLRANAQAELAKTRKKRAA